METTTLVETVKIQIYPTDAQILLFRKTQQRFIEACQFVSDYVFENRCLEQRFLHDTLYRDIRKNYELPSQMAASVVRVVIARYKTVSTQFKKRKYRFRDINTNKWHTYKKDLSHLQKPITFKNPVVQLVRNRNYSLLKEGLFSIGTLEDRQKVAFSWPENRSYFEKFQNPNWIFGQAELLERRGKWYLHIAVSRVVPAFEKDDLRHVVGIDRGLRQILTLYDETGRTQFFSGQSVLRKRRRYKKLRKQLQSKNTPSSKRRLKAIEHRENRWMSDVNHQLSKALVDYYGPHTLFVIEDLEDVTFNTVKNRRKEDRYEHQSWAFYEFEQFLTYKAIQNQSQVLKVSAEYTSQRCPKCGQIDKKNRQQNNHHFECVSCHYQSNDDRVAAMNIQELGKQWVSGVEKPEYTLLSNNA